MSAPIPMQYDTHGVERPVVLKTVGLTKSYFGNRVVRELDLTVRQGEVYGIVGANGAGKSTLMKMACGYVLPTQGTVEILGRTMRPGEVHGRVGALIEKPAYHPGMSAFNNVMCRALALGLVDPKAEAAKALQMVGLNPSHTEHAASFSLGNLQRLGLALALVGMPDLLFLDEPFNGIDTQGTRSIRTLIQGLVEQRGVTVVISSHVVDQLARFATTYGVMRKGSLVCQKTAAEVERECADSLCVCSPTPERALAVLHGTYPGAALLMLEDGEVRLDPSIPAGEIARVLVGADVEVSSIYTRSMDPEAYFSALMAGQKPSPRVVRGD